MKSPIMPFSAWLKSLREFSPYGVLALAVMLPMLVPGFILTLDLVFTPKLPMPTTIGNDYALQLLLHMLNWVLPGEVIEKLVLLAILMLSGVGMHRLVQKLQSTPAGYRQVAAYFAGILYTLNPFTYSRLMAGQYALLLGYALLPFFARALLQFLEAPKLKTSLYVAVWVTLLSIVSIHSIGMMFLLTLIAAGLAVWQHRQQRRHIWHMAKHGLLGLVMVAVASSYWLLPALQGHGAVATAVTHFSTTDREAFATVGNGAIGKFSNVVRLQGFWVEARDLYLLPQEHTPAWGLLMLGVWVLVVSGAVSAWRYGQRAVVIWLGTTSSIAIILSIGVLNDWLAQHVAFFAGYREPQKFVSLVAFSYAILGAYGVRALLSRLKQTSFGRAARVAVLLLPLMCTSIMLWGCDGQLLPRHYPADWFAVNNRLDSDTSPFKTLSLPWHLYMNFDFSQRIIANPAAKFFDKPMIVSDDPEFKNVAPTVPNIPKQRIQTMLAAASDQHDLGARLAPFNVKYIVVAKDFDYQAYSYLDNQTDLQLLTETASIKLYRNKAFRQ